MSPQEATEDVIYRRAVPGIEEWFRLMEWLLVISALALATGFSKNQYLPILVHISVFLFVVHCVFVLPERFMRSFPAKVGGLSKPRRIFRAFVFLFVLVALILMAYRLVSIAREFGAELAQPVATVAT